MFEYIHYSVRICLYLVGVWFAFLSKKEIIKGKEKDEKRVFD
jgi:hypothetical protein